MTKSASEFAVVFTGPQQAELAPLAPEPVRLGDDALCGRTLVSLVSPGTELHSHYMGASFPCYPGYAAVFRVEQVGAQVTDIAVGSMVLCTGPQGIGGHRSYQRCSRKAVVPVPESLSPDIACHARLMLVSMASLTATAARPVEKMLVTGLGPVGNLAAQLFHAAGYRVSAVDPIEKRRRLLEQICPVATAGTVAELADPDPFMMALDCSGHEQAVLDACDAVGPYGEVFLLGAPWQARTDRLAFDLIQKIYRRYLIVRSGWEWQLPRHGAPFRHGHVFENLAGAVSWLSDGRVSTEGLFTVADPRQAQQVYQDLLHRRSAALSVVFDWRGFDG